MQQTNDNHNEIPQRNAAADLGGGLVLDVLVGGLVTAISPAADRVLNITDGVTTVHDDRWANKKNRMGNAFAAATQETILAPTHAPRTHPKFGQSAPKHAC